MSLVVQHATPEPEEATTAPLTIQSVWGAILRRGRLIAGVFAGAVTLVLLFFLLQPPRYDSNATVMIRPGLDRVLTETEAGASTASTQAAAISAAIDSEVEILRSDETARRVAYQLNLESDPAYAGGQLPFSGWFASSSETRLERAAAALQESVTVRRRGLSEVADITAQAATPQRAAEIANAYVQAYLDASVEAENETTERATEWIAQRLQTLQQEVSNREAAVAAYRAETGLLVGAVGANGESLSEQQIRSVQDNVLLARSELAERTARYNHVQSLLASGASPDTYGDTLNSQVIRDLRNREAELSAAQAQLETTLGERHPAVLNGRQQLADVRSQLRAEMGRIATNAAGEVRVAQARLSTLQASLGAASGQMAGTNQAEVRLAQLMRDASAAQTAYEAFLQRYHQVIGVGETAPLQVRLVSAAVPEESPSWPKWNWVIVIAFLLGVAASALTLLIVEITSDPLVSADEAERRLGVDVLATTPLVSQSALRLLPPEARHPAGYLAEKRHSAYAEAMRMLRTSLRFAGGKGVGVVAVTSSGPNDGKTTCALSLARTAALSGQKVMLLDCDARNSGINKVLSIAPQQGLLNVLRGECAWRDVAGVDDVSSAHVIPASASDEPMAELIESGAFARLLAELRETYELVIIDCPPVWALADARVLAAQADGVLLVGRWNKNSIGALAGALRHLEPSGAHVLGLVINGVDPDVVRRGGYLDAGYGAYANNAYYVN